MQQSHGLFAIAKLLVDYMGSVRGLLYGRCVAGVAGVWFILTRCFYRVYFVEQMKWLIDRSID